MRWIEILEPSAASAPRNDDPRSSRAHGPFLPELFRPGKIAEAILNGVRAGSCRSYARERGTALSSDAWIRRVIAIFRASADYANMLAAAQAAIASNPAILQRLETIWDEVKRAVDRRCSIRQGLRSARWWRAYCPHHRPAAGRDADDAGLREWRARTHRGGLHCALAETNSAISSPSCEKLGRPRSLRSSSSSGKRPAIYPHHGTLVGARCGACSSDLAGIAIPILGKCPGIGRCVREAAHC